MVVSADGSLPFSLSIASIFREFSTNRASICDSGEHVPRALAFTFMRRIAATATPTVPTASAAVKRLGLGRAFGWLAREDIIGIGILLSGPGGQVRVQVRYCSVGCHDAASRCHALVIFFLRNWNGLLTSSCLTLSRGSERDKGTRCSTPGRPWTPTAGSVLSPTLLLCRTLRLLSLSRWRRRNPNRLAQAPAATSARSTRLTVHTEHPGEPLLPGGR